jgi:phosphoglycerate dehydrogenase-like enzyme
MNNVLILAPNAKDYKKELRTRYLPNLELMSSDGTYCSENLIKKANIILGEPNLVAQILDKAEQLKWVQSSFAGVEVLCDPSQRTDYTLTGVKDIFGPLISEYVFAYILALERNIFQTRKNQFNSIWKSFPYRSLTEVKIGICGLGSIGQHLAMTASYFKMKVSGLKRSPTEVDYVEKVYTISDINSFVTDLDYLIITLPSTAETKHLIDKSILRQMKPSAVLINVGRGSVIVENDLIEALQNSKLRTAILDVFEHEPLSESSPLWKMENAIITPHNSAITFPKDIADIFEVNYLNYIKNKPLKYIVDFERGY